MSKGSRLSTTFVNVRKQKKRKEKKQLEFIRGVIKRKAAWALNAVREGISSRGRDLLRRSLSRLKAEMPYTCFPIELSSPPLFPFYRYPPPFVSPPFANYPATNQSAAKSPRPWQLLLPHSFFPFHLSLLLTLALPLHLILNVLVSPPSFVFLTLFVQQRKQNNEETYFGLRCARAGPQRRWGCSCES